MAHIVRNGPIYVNHPHASTTALALTETTLKLAMNATALEPGMPDHYVSIYQAYAILITLASMDNAKTTGRFIIAHATKAITE